MLSENSFLYVSCGVFMPIVLFANSKFRRHSVDCMTMQRHIYINKTRKERAKFSLKDKHVVVLLSNHNILFTSHRSNEVMIWSS